MSARRRLPMRFWLQALAIAPVTLLYLVSLPPGAFVFLWRPWTGEEGVPVFSLGLFGSLALGGAGLWALWVSIAGEGRARSRRRRIALGLGLLAGALVALAWLAWPFTPAAETGVAGLAWHLLEFGAPLAIALRQGALLAKPAREPAVPGRGGARAPDQSRA